MKHFFFSLFLRVSACHSGGGRVEWFSDWEWPTETLHILAHQEAEGQESPAASDTILRDGLPRVPF